MWQQEIPKDISLIRHLHNIGKAEQMLNDLLNEDIFDNLSKHDPYWDSDRLDECRMKFNMIKDRLGDIWTLITPDN